MDSKCSGERERCVHVAVNLLFYFYYSQYMSVYISCAKGQPQLGKNVFPELCTAQLTLRALAVSVFQL